MQKENASSRTPLFTDAPRFKGQLHWEHFLLLQPLNIPIFIFPRNFQGYQNF